MHHLRGACWWFSKTQFSKKNIWFSATLSQSKQLGWIQVIWCNLETIFYILGLRWALFQHGRWTVLEKSKNRREQPWQLHFLISDLELEKCVLDCFWCLQTHPKALKEPKKQNSYQKRLLKDNYDKKTEAVKRHMP